MPRFGEYDPTAWGWPRCADQRYQAYSFGGHGFPSGVVVGTGRYWDHALETLCAQPGFRLPDTTGLDAGCWGQECRPIAGSNRWSFHSYGLALDIAAPWNPARANPPMDTPYRLPTNTGDLLHGMGIEWGGDWATSLDWMHIESHLTPAEMAAWLAGEQAPVVAGGFPLPAGWYFGPFEGPRESVSGSGQDDAQWRPYLARAQTALGCQADGYYGPVTAAAARAWQAAHGLAADGLIGPLTWASLGL